MPSQRLIRRQSLAARLSSYPQDLLLSLNEAYELLEWDSLSNTLSIPFGVALNAIYILACLDPKYQGSIYHEKDVFEGSHIRDSGVFLGNTGPLHSLLYYLSWGLVLFSVANALYVFTKRKNYRMLNAKPNPATPNARRVTLDTPVIYSPGFFSTLTSYVPFRPATPVLTEDGGKAQVWQLSIWDPSSFSLNTFCWFSPLHVLISQYLAPTSLFITIVILLVNTAQLSILISFAAAQQKDKQTLYTQVLSEYNQKFIEPRISVRKRDIGTSTPTQTTPDSTPASSDYGTVEQATPSYGASGADLEGFRRKYAPVQHTPLRHSVSVGTSMDMFSPPAPSTLQKSSHLRTGGMKNSATMNFDLWNAGGSDFPTSPSKPSRLRQESPVKTLPKSTSTPAIRPPSRGPTYVNNTPFKPAVKKRHSGGDGEDKIPGIRRW